MPPASDRRICCTRDQLVETYVGKTFFFCFSELILFLCCTKLHKLHKLQTFFSSLVALASASRLEVVRGYEASELKPMGFRLADLTGHYNAAEMLGAGWSKDRVFGKAASGMGLHWREWQGEALTMQTGQLILECFQEELLKHYPLMVFELKQHGDLKALR